MGERDKEFEKRLLATFRLEAAEHVHALASSLIALERGIPLDERTKVIETAFREAHSLKGAARAVGMAEVEALCQAVESTLAVLKSGEVKLSPGLFDELHESVNRLGRLAGEASLERREPQARAQAEKMAPSDTVRIAAAKLDALLLQAEELLSAKQAAAQRAAEAREVLGEVALLENKSLHARMAALARAAEQDQRSLGAMVDALLADMKKASMLPVASALEVLPKMARDLARDRGKEVELATSGGEIEVDRRVLEEMRDPLIHLVRNAIDHGIEAPEARRRAGKPPRGSISLAAGQKDAGKIEIVVADDGAGIDAEKVRAAARKLGIASAEESGARENDALQLVFQSGVSTSPILTDLSGRGLGLAIVREKVERLGGVVSVETSPGRGAAFRVLLPLTLATFRGVHVRVNGERFVVPGSHVERCVRVPKVEIRTVENRETLAWGGQALALVRLADALEMVRGPEGAGDAVLAVILRSGGRSIAFAVDEILGEQEVLVKGLGRQLARVRNIAGATVLGSGKAVPILNVPDLLQSAVKLSAAPLTARSAQVEQAPAERKAILVVEDSITARALLKNILESAGYRVAAAVDGIEGFTLLKTERFDLVVSDVEMPRMDGFDLTARIRADKTLAELPVVLVTALESREHRERGVDAGANAYVVKSSFDQGNLLDIVRRLL